MGLYKRKDSKHYWMTYRVDGRKCSESTETSNKKLAEKILAKVVTEITEGKWFDKKEPAKITLGELLDRYLKDFSPQLADTTHQRNEQIIKNLKDGMGSCYIKDATVSVISDYKSRKLESGYSKATILKELGLLRRVFSIAKNEWELCRENPVGRVLKNLGRVDNKRTRYLSDEESRKLMEVLPSWLRPIVIMARQTGLRRANLLQLVWDNVDFSNSRIIITKTKNGDPIGMPLSDTALRVLKDLEEKRTAESSYVFCDNSGKPYSLAMVSMAFQRACRAAGVDNFHYHDLRHDFASNLVQGNVDIFKVSKLLGHKDLRMTLRYCHLAPENLRDAVKVLDEKGSGYVLATV